MNAYPVIFLALLVVAHQIPRVFLAKVHIPLIQWHTHAFLLVLEEHSLQTIFATFATSFALFAQAQIQLIAWDVILATISMNQPAQQLVLLESLRTMQIIHALFVITTVLGAPTERTQPVVCVIQISS
jgi:hypothetical protein